MFTLVINDKEYASPKAITVGKWMEMTKWDLSIPAHFKHVLGIAMGVPSDESELIPDELAGIGVQFISSLLNPSGREYKRDLGDHTLINFNTISFSKFIDCEVYLDMGLEKSLDKIVNTLYDCEDSKEFDMVDVFGAVMAYMKFRSTLYKSYRHLFSSDSKEESKTPVPKVWYEIAMSIAEGRLLDLDPVLNKTVIECFNWLAWKKDQQRKEYNEINNIRR